MTEQAQEVPKPKPPPAPPVVEATEPEQETPDGLGPNGYPLDTAVSAMTPEQQAAYWKHMSRKHEKQWAAVRDQKLTPERVLEMQTQLTELQRAQNTDQENAIADARKAGRDEAVRELAHGHVKAFLDAALMARGVESDSDLYDQITGPVDPGRFLTDSGGIDYEAVGRYADLFGGTVKAPGIPNPAQHGHGQREPAVSTTSGQDLIARYLPQYAHNKEQ